MNKKILSSLILAVYLIFLFYLVFMSPYFGQQSFHNNFNFVPFKTIFNYWNYSRDREECLINLLGNILVFLPLGILLPLTFKNCCKFIRIFLIVLFITLFIEIAQYATSVGIADIDDIILNLAGGIIGYLLFKALNKFIIIYDK